MQKKLEDYLHFYLGCECQTTLGVLRLSYVDREEKYPVWFNDGYEENSGILSKDRLCGKGFRWKEVKPILRPLNDMTDEEELHYKASFEMEENEMVKYAAKTELLFKWRFDVFGLIPEGLAIDKTTLPKTNVSGSLPLPKDEGYVCRSCKKPMDEDEGRWGWCWECYES